MDATPPMLVGAEPNTLSEAYAFPASFAQQRLWFLDQLQPGDVSYLIPWRIRLIGDLDIEALTAAINEIVGRHEVLRTVFEGDGEDVLQIVASRLAISLPVRDLSRSRNVEEEMLQLAREEAREPLDLQAGPLVRAKLLRLGMRQHVLLLTLHHIIFDGWSRAIFARELATLYEAFRENRPSPLSQPRLQYGDYAVWQREHLTGTVLEEHLKYWRERLADAPVETTLPLDRPRPAVLGSKGAQRSFSLSPELSAGLQELSRARGATLFMTLLAAFQALLSRYTGQEDLVVGTPIANRSRAELEGVIGFFANTLAVRVDVSGNPSFAELLERVKAVALEAYAHQELPFERLVQELNPKRRVNANPLFQVAFSLSNVPKQAFELKGLELRLEGRVEPSAKFDLFLLMHQHPDHLSVHIEYNAELFEASTVERFGRHFEHLLESILKDPAAPVATLPLLDETEEKTLLVDWNATRTEYPARCVHELFELQAQKRPDAVAIVGASEELTYSELNERADKLAEHLAGLGVTRGSVVGLFVERAPEAIVGMLAILKAGGAYLPLDPNYPVQRLEFMAAKAAATVILTQARFSSRAPEAWQTVVELDRPDTWTAKPDRPRPETTSHDLIYVMYTSGSTGEPKAVAIPHRGVVRFLFGVDYIHFDDQQTFLAVISLSFDPCTFEIWGALLHGAKLVLYPPAVPNPDEIGRMIRQHGVTTMVLPTSLFHMIVDHDAAVLRPLQQLLIGGEALSVRHIVRAQQVCPDTQFVNGYGPTESTVAATCYRIPKNFRAHTAFVSLGRPISNTTVYVLDRHRQLVPIGVVGELYIGGDGLAQGYLGQPELTAQKFITNPFGSGRLYATGDLVRAMADGSFEFIGRADEQVKLRGFRIELGEIETALAQHPIVKECAVIVREDSPGDRRLVAYVVPQQPDVEVPAAELSGWLKLRLLEHMIPAAYVRMTSLPLTTNGKLNRRALPAPDADAYGSQSYEPPQGEVEETLATIWAEALKRERIGRHDNFFQLGGHSLLLVSVIERMRRRNLQVDLRTLFATPTIAEVAAMLHRDSPALAIPPNRIPDRCNAITPDMLPLINLSAEAIERIAAQMPGGAENIQDIYPLAPLQEGILFHHLMTEDGDPYLLERMLRFDSRERLDTYLEAMQNVVSRHDMLRTAVLWDGLPEPVQVVLRTAALDIEEVLLDPADGDVGSQLYERFYPRHYRVDVRKAPLLHVRFAFDRASNCWFAVELLHHLAGDHSTLDLIRSEIQAYMLGRAEVLPRPVPFRNLVAQARLGVSQKEHEDFFRGLLGDVEEPTAPFGLVDVHGDGSGVRQARQMIDRAVARRLRRCARTLGVSAASICHLAFAHLLGRVSGRDDVVFGTVLFGRMQGGEGSDRIVGLFINTLPARIRTAAGVQTSVRETQEMLAELMRHEHASLALAQRCSAVAAPAPLFSALLNYRHSNAPTRIQSADELRAWAGIERVKSEERSNYPLMMSVDDLGEDFRVTTQIKAEVDPGRICAWMNAALDAITEALETSPDSQVRALNILTEAERKQLLEEWNDTSRPYPSDVCVHHLFEEQVRRHPERIAVICENRSITYGELNDRAEVLASQLAGEGPRIGICLERGTDMLIALLGILKSGNAYVPLDPDYPPQRLQHILDDAELETVITSDAAEFALPGFTGKRLHVASASVQASVDGRRRSPSQADVAYVLYTSGSTGKPKGVEITHRNLANFLLSMQQEPGISESDRLLAVTTLSFDIAGLELYLPLISGARVVLATREQARDGRRLLQLLAGSEATILQATPATWRMLLDNGWQGNTRLKALCGGEAFPPDLAEQLLPRCGSVWNMYGPTETTVWSSLHRVTAVSNSIPIGRPIANTTMYVLDAQRRLVPPGVAGELWIGGDGVARGYVNRPDLTDERFVSDPFRSDARMYRTGDLAKYLPDGNLQCLGRVDDQVKIRGFRIELGDIETALGQHPDVKQCAVVVREDTAGDKRLVAYAVFAEGIAPVSTDLRAFLQRQLPDYMVPAAFVGMAALPLTPNGKIDRKALPAPEYGTESKYVAPRTPTEAKLAAIWAEALKVPQVGVHDDFFDLGGHSLLAVTVFARMEREFGEKLPLNILFNAPTVAQIACRLAVHEVPPSESNHSIKPCRAGGSRPPIFAAHGIGGTVLTFRRLANYLDPDQPIYCLEALGLNNGWHKLEELASHYARDIKAFQPEGPYHLIGSSFGGMVAYEIARQLREEGHEVGLVGLLDSYNMGARNLLTRRERVEEQVQFIYKRVVMHLKRLPDRKLSQWPRYAVGRVLAVGRRLHGMLWRTAYRSISTVVADKPSHLINMKRVYELAGMDYYPQVCPGRVVLFRRNEHITKLQKERLHGWKGLASEGIEVIEVPGDHNSIMAEPNVKVLAQEITKWLHDYSTKTAVNKPATKAS